MKKTNFTRALIIGSALGFSVTLGSYAVETAAEKAETNSNETSNTVKRSYRNTKDKACEMINGKMECVGKKMRNKARNSVDHMETKGTELKNKID